MGRVVHFEVTAADVGKAKDFYRRVFGWELTTAFEGYELAATGEGAGIDGAVMARDFQAQPTIVWVEVDDIHAALDRVRQAGGSAVNEINTIPGNGHVVYARDPEGTIIGLKQPLAPDS
jgi:predicted enzyme related to lactoylglutathione lyase